MSIALDMYQTVAIAVLVLMLGAFLRKRYISLKSSAFPLLLLAVCCLRYSPASCTARVLQTSALMIH